MANLATLSFQASHPVRIDWGDGTIVVATSSPATHLYAGPGAKAITLTDTVNGLSGEGAVSCDGINDTTCDFAPLCVKITTVSPWQRTTGGDGNRNTITFGPVQPVQDFTLDWGDGSAVVTLPAGGTLTHAYTGGTIGAFAPFWNILTYVPGHPECAEIWSVQRVTSP
jgi:hypothetical protein